MENKEFFVKQAIEYLDKLPLKKFTSNTDVTCWHMPEADESEWISCLPSNSKDTISIVTDVRVEEHPSCGPIILTRHAFSVHDFVTFKNMIDSAMRDCERAQRKFYSKLKKWKAAQIKECAKNFEV